MTEFQALLPLAKQQFFDNNGEPLVAGTVWHYIPGTSTLKDTYSNEAGTIVNTNPVVLDEGGRAVIWGVGDYRQVVKDVFGTQLYDSITSNIIGEKVGEALDRVAVTEVALAAVVALLASEVGKVDWFATRQAPSGWLVCDGAEVSRLTYSALFAKLVTAAGFVEEDFTVTVATPGVFSKTGHGFTGGERIHLFTTGALPTGLDTTTDYFVKYLTADTFEVSETFGGASVDTTGTQSGVQSYLQTLWGLGDGTGTFNLPAVNDDEKLVAPATASRLSGINRVESIGPHTHGGTAESAGDHNHTYTHIGRYGANPDYLAQFSPSSGDSDGGTPTMTTTTNGAHTHDLDVTANSGLVNLPPTVALLACVYTGVVV